MTLAEQIRALIAAHPDQFTARDLVALLPVHPHDITDRLRLRRINNQVYPLLKNRKRLGPVLVRNPDRTLRVARPMFDVSPEAQAERARAAKARQNAKRRELTAQGKGLHLVADRRRRQRAPRPREPRGDGATVYAAHPPRAVLRAPVQNRALRVKDYQSRAADNASKAQAITRKQLGQRDMPSDDRPCTETWLAANSDKYERLPSSGPRAVSAANRLKFTYG